MNQDLYLGSCSHWTGWRGGGSFPTKTTILFYDFFGWVIYCSRNHCILLIWITWIQFLLISFWRGLKASVCKSSQTGVTSAEKLGHDQALREYLVSHSFGAPGTRGAKSNDNLTWLETVEEWRNLNQYEEFLLRSTTPKVKYTTKNQWVRIGGCI